VALPEVSAELEFGGTATTLLRLGPFTLLTDPNFLHRGQRAYLGYGLWTRRRTEPAIRPETLPPLDAVLLSHLHGDHFDRIAKKRLDRRPPILTTHQAMVIHLGGTRVLGVTVTMDARQGADLVDLLAPTVTVPIHYDDYTAFRSPLVDFVTEVARRAPATQLRVVERGQSVGLGPVGSRHG
jgi:L-ascorbate metabolism protein UlaG (beta-lactamase superfamily)